MTGTVGIFLAIAAGCLVTGRRRVALVVVLPFLVVLAIQTVALAAGKGVSPPSTVTAFPGLISYYLVQAIILSLALAIAEMLRLYRERRAGAPSDDRHWDRNATRGLVVNAVISAAVVLMFALDHPLFDPGSVTHHRSTGQPPVAGVVGILSTAVLFVGLGVVTLVGRNRRSTRTDVPMRDVETVGQSQ